MKKREKIEKQVKNLSEEHVYSEFTRLTLRENIKIELLLDIRDLLLKIFDAEELMKKEISQIKKQEIDPGVLKKL